MERSHGQKKKAIEVVVFIDETMSILKMNYLVYG